MQTKKILLLGVGASDLKGQENSEKQGIYSWTSSLKGTKNGML